MSGAFIFGEESQGRGSPFRAGHGPEGAFLFWIREESICYSKERYSGK